MKSHEFSRVPPGGPSRGARELPPLPRAWPRPTAKKPNILFIMGDDIGSMQPAPTTAGLMVGETPNIDRIAQEGALFMTYYAEPSCTAGRTRLLHRHAPVPRGHGPAAIAGLPLLPCGPARRHLAKFLHDLGLQHRRVRQEPPGRPSGFPADGPRLPGVLGLPVSPGCDAAGELPGHQQQPRPSRPSCRPAR